MTKKELKTFTEAMRKFLEIKFGFKFSQEVEFAEDDSLIKITFAVSNWGENVMFKRFMKDANVVVRSGREKGSRQLHVWDITTYFEFQSTGRNGWQWPEKYIYDIDDETILPR